MRSVPRGAPEDLAKTLDRIRGASSHGVQAGADLVGVRVDDLVEDRQCLSPCVRFCRTWCVTMPCLVACARWSGVYSATGSATGRVSAAAEGGDLAAAHRRH